MAMNDQSYKHAICVLKFKNISMRKRIWVNKQSKVNIYIFKEVVVCYSIIGRKP